VLFCQSASLLAGIYPHRLFFAVSATMDQASVFDAAQLAAMGYISELPRNLSPVSTAPASATSNDFRAGLSGTPLLTTLKFRRYPTTYSTTQNVNCIVVPLIQ
jgi:hypothetical protein